MQLGRHADLADAELPVSGSAGGDPVDAELVLAEHVSLLDLDAEPKADGVDDAGRGPLLPARTRSTNPSGAGTR